LDNIGIVDFAIIERRTGMDTTGAEAKERTPQVRERLDSLGETVERLGHVITEAVKVFRPVLAEIGGETSIAEEVDCRAPLAPLAEDLAEFEDHLRAEIKRLQDLVRRCEV